MGDKQLFMLGGAALLLAGVVFLIFRIYFVRRAASTQGTVVRNDESYDSESGTTYHPVISFVSADNQTIEFSSHAGSNPPKYQVGEIVPVKYLPKNPHRAHIGTKTGLWLFPIGVMVLGLGLFAWGLFFTDDTTTATPSGTTLPAAPSPLAAGQTRLTVVPKSGGAPRQALTSCSAIRETKGGQAREVDLEVEGSTLGFTVDQFTGPRGYPVPLSATVRGTIFGSTDPKTVSGAIVFQGAQTGVVNLATSEITISGTWDCTKVAVQKG